MSEIKSPSKSLICFASSGLILARVQPWYVRPSLRCFLAFLLSLPQTDVYCFYARIFAAIRGYVFFAVSLYRAIISRLKGNGVFWRMSSLFTIAAFLKLCLASAVLGLNCLYGWEIWYIQRECGYIRVQIFDVDVDIK